MAMARHHANEISNMQDVPLATVKWRNGKATAKLKVRFMTNNEEEWRNASINKYESVIKAATLQRDI